MLKRMWAIVLSVAMLVSLCPNVSVFAADTKPSAIVENFEDGTVDSSIVDLTTDFTMERVVVDLEGGGKALKITNLKNTARIGFNQTYSRDANVSILSYDIQVSKAPTTGSRKNGMVVGGTQKNGGTALLKLYRNGNGDNAFSFADQNNVVFSEANVEVKKWYKIITVKYYNVGIVWVIDENGNVVATNKRTDMGASNDGFILLMGNTNILDDGEILIDNINFNLYSRDFGPSLMSDTLAETDVPLSTNSVTVTFDQPLDVLSATLTPEGGSEINCNMVAKTDAKGVAIPLTYVVSWDNALTSNTNYTLDFTKSVAKQGNNRTIYVDNTGKITFTTETVAAPKLVSHNLAETGVLKNVGSVTVTFDSALEETGATLTPAGGSAVACTMTADSIANTYVVTLPTLRGDTAYTLSFAACKNAAGVPVADTISFTTEAASIDETVISDDFEDETLFTGTHYDTGNTKHAFMNNSGKVHSLTEQKAGYTGYGVEVKTNANAVNNTAFYSGDSFTLGAGTSYVVNYKMKITTAPKSGEAGNYTGGTNIAIGTSTNQASNPSPVAIVDLDKFNGEHYIGVGYSSSAASEEGKQGYYFEQEDGKGEWYNATLAVTNDKISFILTDINTGEKLFANSVAKTWNTAAKYYLILAHLRSATEANGNENIGSAITIDDVELWTVNTSKATHALTAEDASANANTVTLTFNQPTMITHNPSDDDETNDMLVVKDNEKNEVIPYSEYDIDIKYTDFDTNVVTISGLEYGESYYLDYSGVKSAGGAAIASGAQPTSLIQFTMPEPTASVMEKALFENGSVELNYWNMDGKDNATFIAAFYNGTTLVDVALLANQTLTGNKNTVSFAAEGVPADADGMIVYALEGLGSLVPLCVPTTKVAIN